MNIKYILLSLASVFLFTISNGQNVKKALKLLADAEYAKCKETLEKNLEDDALHPASNLVMGMLLTEKKSPYYKVVDSWKYVSLAVGRIDAFSDADIESIAEYVHNKENRKTAGTPKEKVVLVIEELENTLIRYIREEHDLKAVYFMLENYPDYVHYDNIAHIRNQFEFYKCKQQNSLEAFDLFIKKFPEAAQIEKAVKMRDELAFKQAVATKTETSLNEFIEKCPQSAYISLAMKLRDSLAFATVKKKNTLDAYEHFVSHYPNAPQTIEARKKLYTLLFEKTKTTDDIAVFNKFITLYPESEYTNTVFNRKANTLGKAFANQQKLNNTSVKWVKAFDFNNQVETAEAMAVTPDGGLLLAGLTAPSTAKETDIWVLKLNNQGDFEWNAVIEQDLSEEIENVLISSKGEVLLVGYTQAQGSSQKSGWMYKLDSKGTKLLNKNLGKIKIVASAMSPDDKIYLSVQSETKGGKFKIQQYNTDGQKLKEREYVEDGTFEYIGFADNDLLLAGGRWILRTDPKVYISWEDTLSSNVSVTAASVTSKTITSLNKGNAGLYYSSYYLSGTPIVENNLVTKKTVDVFGFASYADKGSIILGSIAGTKHLFGINESGVLEKETVLPQSVEIVKMIVTKNGEIVYLLKADDFVLVSMNSFSLLSE